MNGHIPKAYNELMDRLLEPEDRRKLEIIVGAMLTGGEPKIVIICGRGGSGKTTIMRIIHRLQLFNIVDSGRRTPHVVFQHEGYFPIEGDPFIFAEALNEPFALSGTIFVRTTGERLPVNKYYVLMDMIDSELDEIAEHCIRTYTNAQENNR
jgi:hypothetical protein